MDIFPYAGKSAEPGMLANVPRLVTAHYAHRPDPAARRNGWPSEGETKPAVECGSPRSQPRQGLMPTADGPNAGEQLIHQLEINHESSPVKSYVNLFQSDN